MKTKKVMFLVFLITFSLCAINTQTVSSQTTEGIIYIESDGSIYVSTGETLPIEKDGNVYTLTGDIYGYYIDVDCSNLVIDGAGYSIVSGLDAGIDLSYASSVTVKNLQVGSAFYGIFLLNSTGCTITGNTLTYNGYGISAYTSSDNTISGNTLTNNDVGIDIESSSYITLTNNFMNNTHNLAIYGTEGAHYDHTIDTSNTVNGKKVYYLVSKTDLVISPSTYPDAGYLALVNCDNVTVYDMELANNAHGILLAYTTGSAITQNNLTDNYTGIGFFACSANTVSENNIFENYRGVQLSSGSTANSIASNNICTNVEGLFLFDSSQNYIFTNNITDNDIGIGFSESSNNLIRGNYFVDNTDQFYDKNSYDTSITRSTNIWDVSYPLGGNYWSDYTGVDVMSGEDQDEDGSDGIGDTPYTLYGSNVDSYPLMPYGTPFGIVISSPENKTYTTTDVTVEFTVTEDASLIQYSLDGQANVTITGSKTFSDLAEGTHSLTVYAQAADDLTEASKTVYFTIAEGAEPAETDEESFSVTLIIAAIAIAVVVGVASLYFLKTKKE
ncbi:MAG: right-handed parallel beta-helix repeat-containing protein [Candidatus Bathyarchaeota archaeon]|nr:right-handed parallel beta-helix repeat-containing protein [Candidatus Bathyarchaeum sp.]